MGTFDDLIPATAPAAAPAASGLFGDLVPSASTSGVREAVAGSLRRRKAYDFNEGVLAGLENSVPALSLRRPTNELADDASVGGRLGFNAAQMLGDLPVMIAGALMGGGAGASAGGAAGAGAASVVPVAGTAAGGVAGALAGGVVGAGAGAFGLPAGLRATLMDSYDNGEFKDFGDFWDRASHVVWETVKGQITGGATALAGAGATALTKAAAPLVQSVVPTAAELATMTTVGAALEGHVPSAEDFLNGAILLGGMKAAGATAGKLRRIYRETGIPPAQVVADAKAHPEIQRQMTEERTEPPAETIAANWDSISRESSDKANWSDRPYVAKSVHIDGGNISPQPLSEARMAELKNAEIEGLPTVIDKSTKEISVYSKWSAEAFPSDAAIGGARKKNIPGYEPMEPDYVRVGRLVMAADGGVEHVVVSPSFRRRGIGREMMLMAEDRFGLNPFKATDRSPDGAALMESLRQERAIIPPAYREIALETNARQAVPDPKLNPEAAKAVVEQPFADVTQVKGEPARPTEVNMNYLNAAEDVKAVSARLSEIYEDRIQEQRRGEVSNEQTAIEAATKLADILGGDAREIGSGSSAAELLARKQITVTALEDMTARAKEFTALGKDATAGDTAQFIASIERAAIVQSEFLGARAEVGRALQILKSTTREADRAKTIQGLMDKYGGSPERLAEMIGKLDSPEALAAFARDAHKATTWEKVIEAWKAAMLSGPWTHAANLLGNSTFMAMRPLVDAVAATQGLFSKGPDKVSMVEPFARIAGNLQGVKDGARVAIATFRNSVEMGAKVEQRRGAIGGLAGEIVRTPFKLLSAADALFRTMNERGEAYTLAIRQAIGEGININTREFSERVADLVSKPTEEMQTAIEAAGARFTFNEELGTGGKKLQAWIAHYPILQLIAPFVRTPLNIATELARLTPLAPGIKGWREDFAKGGAAQAKAMAELTIGTSLMSAVAAFTMDGTITGQGDPDPGKRAVQLASGWQPYSIKVGDKYYSYQRLQPIGTLMGIAADLATVWDHMTEEEQDKIPKMLSVAFANAVTNQTFLQGITQVVQAAADPTRFGPRFVQGYAGTLVPSILAQPAQMHDPLQREVNSMLDAIKARIPGEREKLLAKRDAFGEPVQTKEKAGFIFPIAISQQSDDPVRLEAKRLGVSVAPAPKKLHIGSGTGQIGDVELTPEQKDKYEEVSGRLAHEVMANVMASPAWAELPDIVRRKAFDKAEAIGHKSGALAALPPEDRQPIIDKIIEKMNLELTKVHKEP